MPDWDIDLRIGVPLLSAILGAGSAFLAVYWFPIWIVLLVATFVLPFLFASMATSQDGVAIGVLFLTAAVMICWNIAHWAFVLTGLFG